MSKKYNPLILEIGDSDSDDDEYESEIQIRPLPKTDKCDLCDKAGHMWSECPGYEMLLKGGGVGRPMICKFCKGEHPKAKCQIIKTSLCPSCGLKGHLESVCNKIALGPGGEVGKCTYKECKGAEKWGHWMVKCPRRFISQGPFKFKEGEDHIKALEDPNPKYIEKRKSKKRMGPRD